MSMKISSCLNCQDLVADIQDESSYHCLAHACSPCACCGEVMLTTGTLRWLSTKEQVSSFHRRGTVGPVVKMKNLCQTETSGHFLEQIFRDQLGSLG